MFRKVYARLAQSEPGVNMVEYGLVIAAIAVVALGGLKALGFSLDGFLRSLPGLLGFGG